MGSVEKRPRLPEAVVEDAMRRIVKEAALTEVIGSARFKSAMSGLKIADLFDLSAKATKLASQWSREYPGYERLMDYVLDGLIIRRFSFSAETECVQK